VSVDIKVKGLREVEQMMRDLQGPQTSRALRAAMLKASQPIVEQAKANVPVGSGALRESISRWFVAGGNESFLGLELPPMGGRFKVKIGPVLKNKTAVALHNLAYRRRRSGVFYGHFIEFGTRIRGKHEFLAPAIKTKASAAIQIFVSTLRASLQRIAKRIR
jgi:HK97 gp10 family phage protein